jgi:hypothetical protein
MGSFPGCEEDFLKSCLSISAKCRKAMLFQQRPEGKLRRDYAITLEQTAFPPLGGWHAF